MTQFKYKDAIFNYEIFINKVTSFYVKTGEIGLRKFIIFGKKQYEDVFDYVISIPENIENCSGEQRNIWLEIAYQNYINNIRG